MTCFVGFIALASPKTDFITFLENLYYPLACTPLVSFFAIFLFIGGAKKKMKKRFITFLTLLIFIMSSFRAK